MKKALKIAGIGCGAVLLVLAVLIFASSVFLGNDFRQVFKTAYSPDGKYVAYGFAVDGGATTRARYEMSIMKKDHKVGPFTWGNVVTNSINDFDFEWTGNREVSIFGAFPKRDEICGIKLKQRSALSGIPYETAFSPDGRYVACKFSQDLPDQPKYHLSIMEKGEIIGRLKAGNAFQSNEIFVFKWTGNDEVTVKSAVLSDKDVKLPEGKLYDIKVKYKKVKNFKDAN